MNNKKEGVLMQPEIKHGSAPRLRFPEFRDAEAWRFQPLEKLAKRSTRKNTDGELTRVLTNSAEYGVVDQRDFFDKDIANQENLKGYYVVEYGSYVYNPRISATAPVGPISKNKISTGVMSPLYTIFTFNSSQNDFYAHYFKSKHWHHYMRQSSSTGARHDRISITNDAFMKLPLPISTPEEQQKIADCLSSLDELLMLKMLKLDAFKKRKAGLLQKLFPAKGEMLPKLRFPEFYDSGKWERKELSEFLFEYQNRNRNLKYGPQDVLSVSGEHGCLNQIEHLGRSYAGASVKDYRVVENGDIVYTKSPLKRNPFGIIKENKGRAGIVSTLYAVYRAKESARPSFFDHYFSRDYFLNAYLEPLVKKGAKNDMKVNNLAVLSGHVVAPLTEEQQKIADCITSINDLITVYVKELDALKRHKKALLQQLFSISDEEQG
jgi:type I restriction enzyme S subunit